MIKPPDQAEVLSARAAWSSAILVRFYMKHCTRREAGYYVVQCQRCGDIGNYIGCIMVF